MTKNDEGYHERIGNDYLMPVYKFFFQCPGVKGINHDRDLH